jgi:uncharacterized protein (DUF1697 family)
MNTWVIFLRGINVGGSTLVSMGDLQAACLKMGFVGARTYLNSGNIILNSALSEGELSEIIIAGLREELGKEIRIVIRRIGELRAIVRKNPFPDAPGSRVGVFLLNEQFDPGIISGFTIVGKEEIRAGDRELYILYPDGMGRSRLKWPTALRNGTMRNINTISKLAGMGYEKNPEDTGEQSAVPS